MFLAKVAKGVCGVGMTGRLPQALSACQARFCSAQPEPAPAKMEKTMNQITLLGRVGANPQKRGSEQHPVVVFSLATHSNYNVNAADAIQKTDWHRICIFKPYLRDTVYRYLTKGQRVLVQGRVTYGDVKDENGNSHTTTSIIAEEVTFFSSNNRMPSDAGFLTDTE